MSSEVLKILDEYPVKGAFVRIEALLQYVSPLQAWHELDSPITKEEVFAAIENGTAQLDETPIYLTASSCPDPKAARQSHINKIAYFVLNKAIQPLDIELGELDSLYISDGNHRLCGAIIRGDSIIYSEFGGFLDSEILEFIIQKDNC